MKIRKLVAYRYPEPLPSEELKTIGYRVGDIAGLAPRRSSAMYSQNDVIISELRDVGRIASGLDGI